MSLTFNTESKSFIDVPAPYFGQDVVIRVNKRAIKHYVRNSQLGSLINSRTDIKDEGDHYLLSAEMPGFKKEDIKLDLENDVMTISAVHPPAWTCWPRKCRRNSSTPGSSRCWRALTPTATGW